MTDVDQGAEGEIGLLDILVVIAESWVVLVVGTVAAASVGLVFGLVQPKDYRAGAEIALTQIEAQRLVANNPMLNKLQIDRDLHLSAGLAEGTTNVEVTAASADALTTRREDVLEEFQSSGQSSIEARRDQLQAQIDQSQQRTVEINSALDRLDQAMARVEEREDFTGDAYGNIATLVQQLETERYNLAIDAQQMQALLTQLPSNIAIAPIGSTESDGRRSPVLIAIVFGFIGGFLLLVAAFVRHGLRAAGQSVEGREKLDRIKRAFLFRPAR